MYQQTEVLKMITRKQYREQEELKNKQKEEFKKLGVLTDEEFYKLSTSESFEYAQMQSDLGLPVTQERDTPYDRHYQTPKERAKNSRQPDVGKLQKHAQTKAAIMDALGFAAFVHIVGTIFRGGKN